MNYQVRAESGCQLLARLAPRPSLNGIDDRIVTLKPNEQAIIELSGAPATGKTLLLLQWAAKALLAKRFGGLGAGVLLIDADKHASLSTLSKLLQALLRKNARERLNFDVVEAAIKHALNNLTVISVCDSFQLLASILSLDKFLLNAPHVSLILVDSLPAFYWTDRLSGGEYHKEKYQQKILTLIQQATRGHQVVLAFTRPADFQSRFSLSRNKLGVSVQCIELKQHKDNFLASVTAGYSRSFHVYRITNEGLIWSEQSNVGSISQQV